ncbi:MAG: TraC family protein [Candidatus Magasanikbacteria bacterium]
MDDKVKQKKSNSKPSTQAHLPIAEIREGVVVLKDGTLRAVLMTSSINFALKSEDEQNALISSYVGFLNSLDFPVQIVIQSRRLQIKPYLEKLSTLEREQKNELLRVQIADYRAFIEELVDIGKIMTKKYLVVVPYDPISNSKKSFWSRFKEVIKPAISLRLKNDRFQKRRQDLDMRVRQVEGGLSSMGLQVVQLDTQALIELYYSTYNPDISFAETLGDIDKQQVETI